MRGYRPHEQHRADLGQRKNCHRGNQNHPHPEGRRGQPGPQMVEPERRMIETGEQQRALKPEPTKLEEKPQPVDGQHVPEASANSTLSQGDTAAC